MGSNLPPAITPARFRAFLAATGENRQALARRMGYRSNTSLRQFEAGVSMLAPRKLAWLAGYVTLRERHAGELAAWLALHPPDGVEFRRDAEGFAVLMGGRPVGRIDDMRDTSAGGWRVSVAGAQDATRHHDAAGAKLAVTKRMLNNPFPGDD